MKREAKILAAKNFLAMALSTGPVMMAPAQAGGIPVIDVGKLTQNVMTAMESVAQTLKQIEPYRTQLQQYENMLRNTAAPAAYIRDQAINTMNLLRGAIDTLNYYKANLGRIERAVGVVAGEGFLMRPAVAHGQQFIHQAALRLAENLAKHLAPFAIHDHQ